MEMLAIMHEATPYGHFIVSGKSPTNDQIAVLAGTPSDQVSLLLGELESAGVFSRTARGVIYSRRMTRDEKKARMGVISGKRGGNPTLCKKSEKPSTLNGTHNGIVNGTVIPRARAKPEARDRKTDTEKISARENRSTSEIVKAVATAAKQRPGTANFDDPAVRKARWQQKVLDEIRRRLPAANAEIIIRGYMAGEREAIQFFEKVDASIKAREART